MCRRAATRGPRECPGGGPGRDDGSSRPDCGASGLRRQRAVAGPPVARAPGLADRVSDPPARGRAAGRTRARTRRPVTGPGPGPVVRGPEPGRLPYARQAGTGQGCVSYRVSWWPQRLTDARHPGATARSRAGEGAGRAGAVSTMASDRHAGGCQGGRGGTEQDGHERGRDGAGRARARAGRSRTGTSEGGTEQDGHERGRDGAPRQATALKRTRRLRRAASWLSR